MRHGSRVWPVFVVLLVAGILGNPAPREGVLSAAALPKMDRALQQRAKLPAGKSRIIIQSARSGSMQAIGQSIARAGGALGRTLPAIGGQVAVVPNAVLTLLAANPTVERLSLDRRVAGTNERTGATVGATAIRQSLGYDGSGIGIAIIDSGIRDDDESREAVTALAREEDRRQALSAGFQLHLAKPIDARSLVAAVASLGRLSGV